MSRGQEVAGVGTAAVLLPIKSLTMGDRVFAFGVHDVMSALRDTLEGIQRGEIEDRHGWTRRVELVPMTLASAL